MLSRARIFAPREECNEWRNAATFAQRVAVLRVVAHGVANGSCRVAGCKAPTRAQQPYERRDAICLKERLPIRKVVMRKCPQRRRCLRVRFRDTLVQ